MKTLDARYLICYSRNTAPRVGLRLSGAFCLCKEALTTIAVFATIKVQPFALSLYGHRGGFLLGFFMNNSQVLRTFKEANK